MDPEGGSQKATLVVLLLVVTGSVKIPKAFLIRSGAGAQPNYRVGQNMGPLCFAEILLRSARFFAEIKVV